MRPIIYLMVCWGLLSFSEHKRNSHPPVTVAGTQGNDAVIHWKQPVPADTAWIQKILDNWQYVCEHELTIEVKGLPWIIFYDSSSAWHVNADVGMLPAAEKTSYSVVFAGITYPLVRLSHTDSLWVPDRAAIPLAAGLVTTIPYAQNKKAFFIAPLPSLFHKFAPPDQASFLDFLFLGNNIHELTHTRQLPFVLPQLLAIHDAGKYKSLNDNTVEEMFSGNERYKQLYAEENTLLWNAAFTTNKDSCITVIEHALKRIQIRKREFFSGRNQGLGQADEIFLSLEGSAMWAQYRVMLKNAPNPNERELLSWLTKQGPAWSQVRGLVLFLLINRFDPDWKDRFFEKPLPPATDYLREVLARRKK
jgi:hypothetical protein